LIDVGGELPRSIRATSSDSCDHEQLLREVGDLSYVPFQLFDASWSRLATT
jgi:hypothetical protein